MTLRSRGLSFRRFLLGGAALGLLFVTSDPIRAFNDFIPTGPMVAPRYDHTATLLSDGTVLVVGGHPDFTRCVVSAEIYRPALGTFTATGSMAVGRCNHTATLLGNGDVLITGGLDGSGTGLHTSSEIYNPTMGTFSTVGSMSFARQRHAAGLLGNGTVLIAGGGALPAGSTAEIYDPYSRTFTTTGSMSTARDLPTMTVLANGRALLAGGARASADLYDPVSGTFTATGSMSASRFGSIATLLGNGRVLVAGGVNNSSYEASAEIYDPASGAFTVTGSLSTERYLAAAALVADGKVLVAGGRNASFILSSAELYDPATGTFTAAGNLSSVMMRPRAAALQDGTVLVMGGYNGAAIIPGADLYRPAEATTTLTVGAASAAYGGTTTLSGSLLAPGIIAGRTITFVMNGTPVGATITDSAGVATLGGVHLTAAMTVGSYPISATFAGDPGLAPSTGSSTVTVSRATATIAVTGAGSFVYNGQAHTASAAVTGAFYESLGAGTITYTNLGNASTSVSAPISVGMYQVNAAFAGDTNYLAGADNSPRIAITPANTATTASATSSSNPSVFGQPVTFTATVSAVPAGAGTPTGTVTFKDGATTLGTGTVSAGSATFTTAALSVASHSITASYGGDVNFTASTAQSSEWQQLSPTGAGPEVNSQQFVSDGQGNLIIFGGCGPTACNGSTSTWTLRNAFGVGGTPQWVQIPTVGGNPGVRHAHVLAYDSLLNELIVSGGCAGGCFPVANTTWKLTNGNGLGAGTSTWSQVIAAAPPANGLVVGQFAALDSEHGELMIFGGQNGGGSACFGATTGATETVNTSTFTWAPLPTSGGPPGAQYLAQGGYDPGSNRLIVSNGWGCGLFNELWILTHANGRDTGFTPTWIKLLNQGAAGSPPGGPGPKANYSPARNTMFLVEGGSPSVPNFWRLSNANGLGAGGGAATPVWTLAGTTGGPLGATAVGGVAYDAASDRLLAQLTVGNLMQYWIIKAASGSVASISQAVTPASTTTTVASDPNPSMFGQSVTLTANVWVAAPGAGVAAGTVTFRNGATTLGTAALDAGGQATFTTSSLSPSGSPYGITAVYAGDTNFTTSTSPPLSQVVNPVLPPTAIFAANPNPAACNQTLIFNGSGSNASPPLNIVAHEWDFGDGATGAGSMVTHEYGAFGTYTATLTVTDSNVPAKTATTTQTITVSLGNQAPVASAGGPYAEELGVGLNLNGHGSSDPNTSCGDSIVSYAWTIDGTLSLSGATPTLSAAQIGSLGVGSHSVSLTVTDEFGLTGTASTTLTVYNNMPTASFTANPNPAACNQEIIFDGGGSHAGRPDRAIRSYVWTFGDGVSESGQVRAHSYGSFGSYTATLTVTDNNVPAKTATATQTIDVNQGNQSPFANAGGPYNASFGSSVQLNGGGSSDANTSCGDQIVSYGWTIDGTISLSGPAPTLDTALNPLTVGSHNVSLTVTDTFGATSTVSTVVNVQRVLVSIEVTPAMATIGLGGQQSFQAIGHYNDGSTQVLSSDNGGGGGGSGPPLWQVHFGSGPGQGLNVDACTTPQYPSVPGGYSSQVFAADQSTGTIIPTVWSPSTPIVQVNGTITPAAPGGQVVATLTCTTPGVPATGSIAATWSVSQSRYIGTFTDFAGHTGSVTITGWSPQAAMPTRRFSFGAATVNGLAYAIGGGNELSFVTAVDAFNPATDMWTTGFSPMPTAREGLGVAALNQRIYAIGGHVAGGNPSGVVEVYDPVADIWTTLPQSEWMPTPRAGLALVADGNYLFAIGGATQSGIGGQVAIVERYDPAAHTWSTLTPMPVAGTASAGVLNGTIVVFGSGGTTRTDLYDIATDMWHPGVPMPAQRGGMAVAAANGGLWLVGGTSNGAFTYDTWVYYPATGTRTEGWAGIGPMLTARLSLAAAVVDDVVYAIGGAIDTTAPVSPLSTNEALSTPPFGDLSTIQSSSSGAVQWQSTNGNVATIDQNGNATGVATGSTTIIASAGSIPCLPDHCGELTVINRVPIVQIFGGPYNTNESQFQNFGSGGSFSDLDPQSWTATVDYGDGTGAQALSLFNLQSNFTPTGQFNLSHAYRDNGVYTVTVTVDDDAGGVGTATAQVTVNNVAPQVSGPSSATLQLGSSQNFGCAALFDSGTLDAPWSATVDYGDGAGPQVVTNLLGSCGGSGGPDLVGAFNLSHVYTSTGTFTVTATATDKDGGVGTGTTSVTVNKAMPSMSLSVSPSGSITYGQNVTFTATVTTSMTGIAAPTGTVTFTVDGTPVAAPGLVSGQASYSTSSLNVGNHNIVATYSGDVNFNSVLRNTSRFIGRISPSMTLTSSSPSSTLGEAVTFTATVADPKGVVTATGPVTFTIDGSQVASPNLMNGQAIFSTSGLSLGSHGISASYNGDANFFSSSRFTGHFVNACQGSIRGTLLNHGAPFTGMVQFIVTAGADTFPFTTDTGGFFFDEVDEGTYHLQVVPPPGYTATPAELDFTVSCGQQADLIFEVGDTTPPAITLNGPNPMTIEGGSTFADPGATATDSLAGDLTPAIVAAGTVDTTHVGSYTRTYTVSDGYNSTSTTRTVSVVDTTPPAFTSPPSATINATSPAGASYFYTTPAATDAVVGTVTVACNPPPGSVFPIGTTIVTCTATDQAGNSTTHVFTVTILSPQDMIANLISQVGELDFRQTSSLLQNVLRSLDNSNTGAGCNQLAAFIAQVQAQSGKKLTVVEATALIQAATDARGALGCG